MRSPFSNRETFMPAPQDRTPDAHVDVGSQRARQGQNIRGMRKVLIAGILLTALGFAVLLLGYAAWETEDPSPGADLATETNPQIPPPSQQRFDSPPEPDPGAVGSTPGTVPQPPGGPGQPGVDDARGTPGK